MPQTLKRIITPEGYVARLAPVLPPSTEELFEYERTMLAEKRLAPVEMFDRFLKKLPASGLFILLPPQPAPVANLDWNELMARMEWSGKIGKNFLASQHLADLREAPTVPTVLPDVEDGRARLNIAPSVSREAIAHEGREDYTLWRGYIHTLLFTMVLAHHGLDLLGSRCHARYVPFLYLSDGKPALSSYWGDYVLPRWGAPSCGSQLVA